MIVFISKDAFFRSICFLASCYFLINGVSLFMFLSILNVLTSNPWYTVLSVYFHLGLIHLLMISLEGLSHPFMCFGFWFEDTLNNAVCVFSSPVKLTLSPESGFVAVPIYHSKASSLVYES